MNVSIKISFDVKIVRTEIIKLKTKNSLVWLDFAFCKVSCATYLKNPILSSKTDKLVQDKNKISFKH